MSKVAIFRCEDYSVSKIQDILMRALELLDIDLTGYKKLLLKPNLLTKKRPEEAVTTHPEVLKALIRILRNSGRDIIVADSPGGPYTSKRLEGIYEATGIKKVCAEEKVELNYDTSFFETSFDKGNVLKKIPIIMPVKNCDGVISVAKLKTHRMAVYTGAVKNLFGLIPGGQKIEFHFRMQELDRFMDLLLDLYLAISPVFSIIDGILAMEGDGPSAGNPRNLGVLIISKDGIAADYVASQIIGLKKEDFPLIDRAIKRGLFNPEDVEVLGENIENLKVKDFKIPLRRDVNFTRGQLPKFFESLIKNSLTPKPVIMKEKCVGCGECFMTCPAKAISIENKKAQIDLLKCIRCYCCHELCPEKAIRIKRFFAFKTLLR